MKNLLVLVLALFVGNSFADLRPLATYLNEKPELDNGSVLYVGYRCLGLLGMVTNITTGSTNKNSEQVLSLTKKRTKTLLDFTYKLQSSERKETTPETFLDTLESTVRPIADKYQTIANENYLNNGAYFEGSELLESDITICNEMIDSWD